MSETPAQIARRTRREQGLPERVDDPTTLQAVADLLRSAQTEQERDKRHRRRKAS